MRILKTKELYLDQSGFSQALALEKRFSKKLASFVSWTLAVFCLVCLFLGAFFFERKMLSWVFLGGAEIFLGLFLLALVYWLYLSYLERNHILPVPELEKAWNHEAYGRILSFKAAQVLDRSAKGEDFLLAVFWNNVLNDEKFLWILRRLNIEPQDFAQKVNIRYPSAAALSLQDILKVSWQKILSATDHLQIEYPDLLMAVFELDKICQEIMFEYEVDANMLVKVAAWQRRRDRKLKSKKQFWTKENLLDIKGIGKDWSFGYTINLDRVAVDLTERVKFIKPPEHLYGHRSRIELLEQLLLKTGRAGNVVLVGPGGVGKHTLLSAFAQKVRDGRTLGPLRYLRLLQIDSGAVIAGTTNLNEVVEKIDTIFGEACAASNVILVINDIDAFLDPTPEAGRVNATEALLPFFQSRLRVIGLTTPTGYQTTIGKNPRLAQLISKLEINEPSPDETLLILQDEVEAIESQSGLFFTQNSLEEIVKLATRLIQNLPNPEKSLEILEETAVYVATKTPDRLIVPEHVQRVVTLRTKVPVEKIKAVEKEVLLNLEDILHQRIIGQHEAIGALSDALRRARSGIRSEKRPIGSFLFLGPTGVGKTETAKALASLYFGSENRIIRLDMAEYQEIHSINRLLGDTDARRGGYLTEAVIANPFSLILLDELEKAHPKVLDLFLPVFDDGRLIDALGRTIDFTNTMIIATSNAGALLIREMTKAGRNPAEAKDEILDYLQKEGIFRPEFLNRFDAILVFRPLNEQEQVAVATLLLSELNTRLAEKDIAIKVTLELAQAVVSHAYSPEFGARPLRRYIMEHIENYIARALLSGEIQRGEIIEIGPEVLG